MLNRVKRGLDAMPGTGEGGTGGPIDRYRAFSARTTCWAKVLGYAPGHLRRTFVRLEVHDDEKVYEASTVTRIPRGEKLELGAHVALVPRLQLTRSDAWWRLPGEVVQEEAAWEASWAFTPWWWPGGARADREPRWGSSRRPDWKIHWGAEPCYGVVRPTQEQMQEEILGRMAGDLPDAFVEVERLRAAGEVSEGEMERVTSYLTGAVSLDELHASGGMTDAAHAQASAVRAQALAQLDALRASGVLTEEQYRMNVARLP